jgi:cell division protein FtsW
MIFVVAVLLLFGLVIGYSASAPFSLRHFGTSAHLFVKQLTAAALGLVLFFFFARFDYHRLRDLAEILLVGSFLLTVVTLLPLPRITDGRWLLLGPFALQPTELVKFGLVVYLATAIERKGDKIQSFTQGILPFVVVFLVVAAVVMKQPDLGMILLFGAVTAVMLFLGGAKVSHLALLGLAALPIVYVAIRIAPYRLARIVSFLHPEAYSTSSGYQAIQSLVAVGSGGILGRGLGASRAKLFYLPQAHNDFIFSVAAEELGLLGALALLSLFAAFTWRAFVVARQAPDRLGRLLAWGIGFAIAFQAFLNLAVALGLVPVTGLTLPFVSNGGSSLLITLAMVGVLQNVARQGG